MRIIGHAPAGVSPPFFLSSLPDLIRQSMRTKSSIGSADKLSEPHVSMDHRVKPGGDEVFAKTRARIASRERVFMSSLPGLTRQSMRWGRSLGLAVWLAQLLFSMDHRVKPGGDEMGCGACNKHGSHSHATAAS